MFNIDEKFKLNQFIAKKNFNANNELSKSDKAVLTDDVKKIILTYQLQPTKMNVNPYKDDTREYPLINVFEIIIGNGKKVKRIAEIVFRAIPFPCVLVFRFENNFQIWTAHQRTNINDETKNIIEEMISTNWVSGKDKIFEKLDIKKMRFTDFYALYSDIVDTICIYNAEQKGIVKPDIEINGEMAREIIRQSDELDDKIAKLKAKIKNETQFNRKVEMNLEIMELEVKRRGKIQ